MKSLKGKNSKRDMDILGLSKGEIDELFKKDRQAERAATRQAHAEIKRNKAEQKRNDRYEASLKADADELLKKEQEEADRLMKREADDKQKIMNLQILKKYDDGATLKSLMDEYNVSRQKLIWLLKKNKSTQTS